MAKCPKKRILSRSKSQLAYSPNGDADIQGCRHWTLFLDTRMNVKMFGRLSAKFPGDKLFLCGSSSNFDGVHSLNIEAIEAAASKSVISH